MKLKKFISSFIAISALAGAVPINSLADETVTHTVTLLDFDGNVMQEIQVEDGQDVDLSSVDTSSLETHPDVYTQVGFNAWSSDAKNVKDDLTIQALYIKMILSLDSIPERTEYFAKSGKVMLDGLKVSITADRQTSVRDDSGDFQIEREILDITSSCKTLRRSNTAPTHSLCVKRAFGQVLAYPISASSALQPRNTSSYVASKSRVYHGSATLPDSPQNDNSLRTFQQFSGPRMRRRCRTFSSSMHTM